MGRTAEHTIKGFIYQFLVTLSKLLESTDSEVTVEGVIEDIDVSSPGGITAYQCKYHETKLKFTLSSIYKPILQMLCHFKNHRSASILYRLHAHFPNETVGSIKTLTSDELKEILATTTVGLQSMVSELKGFTDTDTFLKSFEIHFGSSYDDLESSIIVALSKEGLSTDDVKEILYPNAVHKIAELSTKAAVTDRTIIKTEFVAELKKVKTTAVSRWTKELQAYNAILKRRRAQLRFGLSQNTRNRCIVIDSAYLVDFQTSIVQLIADFVRLYNFKMKLHLCPTISLKCNEEEINVVWKELDSRGLKVERGYKAGELDVTYFLRYPMKNYKDGISEFDVRLCNYDRDFDKLAASAKFDDIIIIAPVIPESVKSINNAGIEHLETASVDEVKYLLSLKTTL